MKVKKKRKKIKWIFNMGVFVILAVIISQIVVLRININDKKSELNSLKNEEESLKSYNQTLQNELNGSLNDQYIEKVAREKLNYVSPFERVFINVIGQ